MKLVLAIGVLFMATGCSWFKSASVQAVIKNIELGGCTMETNAITAAAQSISNTLQCANVAAVQADLTKAIGNLNICKIVAQATATPGSVQMKGLIANLICPLASSAVVGFATQAVPAGWGCTVSTAADQVKGALTAACELIPY